MGAFAVIKLILAARLVQINGVVRLELNVEKLMGNVILHITAKMVRLNAKLKIKKHAAVIVDMDVFAASKLTLAAKLEQINGAVSLELNVEKQMGNAMCLIIVQMVRQSVKRIKAAVALQERNALAVLLVISAAKQLILGVVQAILIAERK